jgi:hypothetical protein
VALDLDLAHRGRRERVHGLGDRVGARAMGRAGSPPPRGAHRSPARHPHARRGHPHHRALRPADRARRVPPPTRLRRCVRAPGIVLAPDVTLPFVVRAVSPCSPSSTRRKRSRAHARCRSLAHVPESAPAAHLPRHRLGMVRPARSIAIRIAGCGLGQHSVQDARGASPVSSRGRSGGSPLRGLPFDPPARGRRSQPFARCSRDIGNAVVEAKRRVRT